MHITEVFHIEILQAGFFILSKQPYSFTLIDIKSQFVPVDIFCWLIFFLFLLVKLFKLICTYLFYLVTPFCMIFIIEVITC